MKTTPAAGAPTAKKVESNSEPNSEPKTPRTPVAPRTPVGPQRSWGRLRFIREWSEPLEAPKLGGGTYLTGEFGPIMWELECDCGSRIRDPGRPVS